MGNRIGLAMRPTMGSVRASHPSGPATTDDASGKRAQTKRGVSVATAGAARAESVLGGAPEDVEAVFSLGRELGSGQFGVTRACTHKATGQAYACKTIAKYKLTEKTDIEDVRREVQIMRHLAGVPNIVELIGAYEDKRSVHLVMELCAGGELFDRIIKRGHFSERAAAGLCRTIVRGVQACHSRGVMHRDLKPENFLFLNKQENSPLKVADFGASVFFHPGQTFTDLVGTPFYIAPEVLKRSYGPEADIWSVGAILYMLLSGFPPFYAQTKEAVFQEILEGQFDLTSQPWPTISSGAKDLVGKMLKQDPKERLTAYEVLNHAWIREDGEAPDTPIHSDTLTRMKQFRAINEFKKIALKVIAKSLSEEEIARLKEMFNHMDTDNNGIVTFEELKRGLARQGFTLAEAEIRQLLEAADVDGNGTINYEEFITATMYLNRVYKEDHLHAAFQHFDKDQSGYITMEELEQAFTKYGTSGQERNIKEILANVDTDKDGRINYDEFVAMMKKGRPAAANTSKKQRGKTSVVGAAKYR